MKNAAITIIQPTVTLMISQGYPVDIVTRDFDFITVTQRRDWQGTGSGQLMRRPSDRLPFALQQNERKALPATILSPTAGPRGWRLGKKRHFAEGKRVIFVANGSF